ncbi:hypothetical protein [Acinetobacter terrae]|uniref:Holliday junction resolvase RuvX n=1 Tax=Acinetobacter terrae TaxID=2731247 RepID=A0A4R0ENZ2_9GAMM|nr:hypothetical protein [Acinetobacter terrae]TCB60325.1 hypothetical protein E0H85_06020 [Acinetobacter terrae]
MKVIGFRSGSKSIRFAILEKNGENISLINSDKENELKIPITIKSEEDQIDWVYCEIERILRQNSNTDKIVVKMAEFTRSDTKVKRLISYFDAVILLNAKKANKEVTTKLYSQIGIKRMDVKEKSEAICGKTKQKWDEQIADAIYVAYSEF